MKRRKKIVRNFAVFCAESQIRNMQTEIEAKKQGFHLNNDSIINFILSDALNEQTNINVLQSCYYEALQGKENSYFSTAYFFDRKHALRIDNSKILLYYYQDEIKIGLPWRYPHLISCIGSVEDHCDQRNVCDDLVKLSMLDFFLKYFFHKSSDVHNIEVIHDGYIVDEFLKISIDVHVTFQWIDSSQDYQEKYICDVWWYSKENILKDIIKMNLLKFGKKYNGFWGK